MFPRMDYRATNGLDGHMDPAVQFILGLYLVSAFIGLVWLMASGG